MANEDVQFDIASHCDDMATLLEPKHETPYGVVNTLRAAAAELREAREDTKRLARAARLVVEIDGDYCACIKSPDELAYRCLTCLLKEEIDAAMKPLGGEESK